MELDSYEMTFSGEVLQRGFWLYCWKIEFESKNYFYVGRTGDSSSAHASSPFNRIGQHLDFKANAKGNSLARRLKEVGIEPKKSIFNMLALGPFFEEQDNFEKHKPKRDYMATLEVEAATQLMSLGHTVLGVHHKGAPVPVSVINEVRKKIGEFSAKAS